MRQERSLSRYGIPLLMRQSCIQVARYRNKSADFSPFECLFRANPNLPIDNCLGIAGTGEKRGTGLIQANAKLNREEAARNYKVQHDKNAHVSDLRAGQEVLIKRNFWKYPKQWPNVAHWHPSPT